MNEWPNWVLLLVRLVLSVSASAFMTWVGWKLGQRPWALVAFVFSTPLIGVAIARPSVELAHEGLGWLWDHPMREYQGRYYAFNNVQVRVLEDRGRLWFCASDVLKATGVRAVASALPGTSEIERLACLDIDGVERLHETHRERELGKFVLWARREVIAPWERKR